MTPHHQQNAARILGDAIATIESAPGQVAWTYIRTLIHQILDNPVLASFVEDLPWEDTNGHVRNTDRAPADLGAWGRMAWAELRFHYERGTGGVQGTAVSQVVAGNSDNSGQKLRYAMSLTVVPLVRWLRAELEQGPPPSQTQTPVKELRFIEHIGDGGFAGVWRAHDPVLGRDVAVKVFQPTDVVISSALDHARALARVRNPNVVMVHEIVRVQDPEPTGLELDAVVMELVEGERLGDRLQGRYFELDEAERIGVAVLDGVTAIHEAGLAHADLHEGNVLLDGAVGAKVIDILYWGSLADQPTATREQRRARDVGDVRALLGLVLRNTDLDPTAGFAFRQATDGVGDLLDLRIAFLEALAAARASGAAAPSAPAVLTAARPDVRVKLSCACVADGPGGETRWLLTVSVENHSPVKLYLSSIQVEVGDGQIMQPTRDAVLRTPLAAAVIDSGDAHAVHLDPAQILAAVHGDSTKLGAAVATDKIGRAYRSDPIEATVSAVLRANQETSDG